MPRKALFVGINQYDNFPPLRCCTADAIALGNILLRNDDKKINFVSKSFIDSDTQRITKSFLRNKLHALFSDDFNGDALFYFSGHGTASKHDGYLVTQDGEVDDYGIPMYELLTLANNSKAKSVILILDCCHSGQLGNLPNIQGSNGSQTQLREGVTILAASKSSQPAVEIEGHGAFTQLLISALLGGAADVRGRVSVASVYAYAEQALNNPWGQSPVYKSHADCLPQLRFCTPMVEDSDLRLLPRIFATPTTEVQMDPSFEHSKRKIAIKSNVELFDKFKCFRNASLLVTQTGKDLYYTALKSESVRLTLLGQFYWNLAQKGAF